MTDAALNMLGLCARAGRLITGEKAVVQAVRAGGCHAVVRDGAAAGNAEKAVSQACRTHGVPLVRTGPMRLGDAIGRPGRMAAAVTDPGFVEQAVRRYQDKIAVGVDIRDGLVAIRGWTATSGLEAFAFCRRMEELGVKTIISTDISRDGALQGANRDLYQRLSEELKVHIIASGGVSSVEDILALRRLGMYGAIVGKAYYEGRLPLRVASEAAV